MKTVVLERQIAFPPVCARAMQDPSIADTKSEENLFFATYMLEAQKYSFLYKSFNDSTFMEGQRNTIYRKFAFDEYDYMVESDASTGDLLLML